MIDILKGEKWKVSQKLVEDLILCALTWSSKALEAQV